MSRELLLPKLGLTITEGTILEWLVAPGDRFDEGQILLIIESEKAAVEIAAEHPGRMVELIGQPEETLPVGAPIARWDADESAQPSEVAPPVVTPPVVTPPVASSQPTARTRGTPSSGRMIATPLARRMASERGIDLATVQGSGPGGRIRQRDLPQSTSGTTAAPVETTQAPTATQARVPAGEFLADQPRAHEGGSTLQPASATEQVIARRLTQSKREIPHFYLGMEAEVSALLRLRNELAEASPDTKITLNHFLLAAVGRALAGTPEANRVWTDEGFRQFQQVDVGMAVDSSHGLRVPILRNLGHAPLAEVARKANLALEQARAGKLSAQDMSGGAITVSNAGMHGVTWMASIIDPAQSMILGVGGVRELFRPDAAGQPALKREIGLMLSVDHRVMDGVLALRFLKRVVALLERPMALLL